MSFKCFSWLLSKFGLNFKATRNMVISYLYMNIVHGIFGDHLYADVSHDKELTVLVTSSSLLRWTT